MKLFRSAVTGRFVSKEYTRAHPDTSVEEVAVDDSEAYDSVIERLEDVLDEIKALRDK